MTNTVCTQCSAPFEVTADDMAFYERISPQFDGVAYAIPSPTHCPECRQMRRLTHVNEQNYYQAECGLCNKNMLTQWPPHLQKNAYCQKCWHSDKWDASDFGREIDFDRPFFEQFNDLLQDVPVMALLSEGVNVNSEYIHYAGFAKNCYLISHADYCEDCYYGYGIKHSTSCVDGLNNFYCELCYDCIDCYKCYGLKGCQDCSNCHSSSFLRDCIGCKNCFLCVGLREKEYCFENEQLTKKEYEDRLAAINLSSYKQYQACHAKLKELEKNHHFKELQGHNTENCSGDHLNNCKNTHHSFDCEDIEDGKYCYQVVIGAKDVYDIYQYGLNIRESYECCVAGNDCYKILFSHNAHINCSDLTYCWYAVTCKNCFGCASLHHKQYCILNKQYSEEEYNTLVPRLIKHMQNTGEWGEFFPVELSEFGYNKTTAQLYYPLTKDSALGKGFLWDDYEPPPTAVTKTISAQQLPDSISDVPDDILNWAIICQETNLPFRITPHELRFYREQQLPIPRLSSKQRHFTRHSKRNPRQFWERQCAKCSKDIRTTYSPERPETVYCEKCYLTEVY